MYNKVYRYDLIKKEQAVLSIIGELPLSVEGTVFGKRIIIMSDNELYEGTYNGEDVLFSKMDIELPEAQNITLTTMEDNLLITSSGNIYLVRNRLNMRRLLKTARKTKLKRKKRLTKKVRATVTYFNHS